MSPDGVAIFLRDHQGEEQPVEFTWGTDAASIERVWDAAVKKLSAKDADELRREGYYARLVSLTALASEDIGQPDFIETCLRQVEVLVDRGDCTSHAGNETVTQSFLEAILASDRILVPLPAHAPALPEFAADYLDCLDAGDVELPLYFVLQERTPTHAIYAVQEWEPPRPRLGKMAPSRQGLERARHAQSSVEYH